MKRRNALKVIGAAIVAPLVVVKALEPKQVLETYASGIGKTYSIEWTPGGSDFESSNMGIAYLDRPISESAYRKLRGL